MASSQMSIAEARPLRADPIRDALERLGDALPEGEDCRVLMDFLEEMQFECVGAFTYSPQEGTRAAQMEDNVPEGVKRDRLEQLTDLQRAITAERYEQRVGMRVHALVERAASPDESGLSVGRLPWQADDIDGVTWLDTAAPAGSFVEVEVTDVVDDYDFSARVISVLDAPVVPSRIASRELPLATIGSFGR